MKTLKITLLLALFLSVSSQSDKTPADQNVDTYKVEQGKYIFIAHNKVEIKIPSQG